MNFPMLLTAGLLDFLLGLEPVVLVLLALLWLLMLTGVCTSRSSDGSTSFVPGESVTVDEEEEEPPEDLDV